MTDPSITGITPKAFAQLQQLFKDLKNASTFFNNEYHRNIVNLLFPVSWQQPPNWEDYENRKDEYKQVIQQQFEERLNILRAIVKYVIATKRFDTEYGI